jgi:hypothetical protein
VQNQDTFFGVLIFMAWLIATMFVNALYQSNFQKLLWEVNGQLAPQKRFSPFWWYGSKHRRLLKEYRTLFPSGPLIQKLRTLGVIQFLVFGLLPSAFGLPIVGIAFAVVGSVVTWFVYRV